MRLYSWTTKWKCLPNWPQNVWVDSHFEGIQGLIFLYIAYIANIAIVVPRISATVDDAGWSSVEVPIPLHEQHLVT